MCVQMNNVLDAIEERIIKYRADAKSAFFKMDIDLCMALENKADALEDLQLHLEKMDSNGRDKEQNGFV